MLISEQDWFSTISRPSRYLGNEINAIRKDPAKTEVSVVLAFPDVYEIGMSHLGLKILYNLLNSESWLSAERVFSPWVDLEKELRDRHVRISTLESGRSLDRFDVIGFSLQHELCFTNVLTLLDLAGISFFAEERPGPFPLVIAGGPACFNPEPFAEFFDCMVVGDGEEAALEICRRVRRAKQAKARDKREILESLRDIPGVYIPSFFRIHYHPDGIISAMEPLLADYPWVQKALVPDIDHYPFPCDSIVPFPELVHDRLAFEISRGCTRGCRFCQAGMIYRPVRERHPESILNQVFKALQSTGYEDLSLLSLSSGDYSCIEGLLATLMDRLSKEKVSVSFPSLRIDSVKGHLMEQVKRIRKTGFTLAPEAGSERLRKIINKGLTREDILRIAQSVYEAGWNLIKLYFMIGLPFEEEGDIEEIVSLAKEVSASCPRRGKKTNLNLGLSPFVPKAHTPFMWCLQIPLEEARRRIQKIHEGLKRTRIAVKWNEPEQSWLEGVFSRGDRRLSAVIVEAWRSGARFDAWSDHFHMKIWGQAFERCGIEPGFYLHRERSLSEILPWDLIHSGLSKEFLQSEWQRAKDGQFTEDCRKGCHHCGVCDHRIIRPVLHSGWQPPSVRDQIEVPGTNGPAVRLRITLSKCDRAKFLSHLEWARVLYRAFRRAGLPLEFSKGFHPMPKISFHGALPLGTESLQETVEIRLTQNQDPQSLMERLNQGLPQGVRALLVERIDPRERGGRLLESHYLITLKQSMPDKQRMETFLELRSFPVTKTTKKGQVEVDARPRVKSMSLTEQGDILLVLRHTTTAELKPSEIVRAVFALPKSEGDMAILKVRQVIGPSETEGTQDGPLP